MGKSAETKERICAIAESAILQKGFAATSIDEIIAEAEITKSGFFYHFKDKMDLARSLALRYIEQDTLFFEELFAQAGELSDDPLQRFLIFIKLFGKAMDEMHSTHPGCLVASYCYQDYLFNDEIRRLNREGMLAWRRMFRAHLDEIAAVYPMKVEIDLDDLADTVSVMVEGGIVLAKVLDQNTILSRQANIYHNFIRMVFIAN